MDTGWRLIKKDDGREVAISCECREKKKINSQWKNAGINTEMRNQTFTNFEIWNEGSKRAKDVAISYYRDFSNLSGYRRNSILLCGQVGSGKTHLSVALSLNLLNRNVKVVYMPYRDIITKIKQNMIDKEYYHKTISNFQSCDVLFIDDLFKGKVNESDINITFEIINFRYLNYLPIIVSTEFSIEKLLEFDESVGSRIYEMCKDYIVEIEKESKNNYRLR